MRTVAILLAAGDSRRMGVPKALLTWQGRTLLEHQIDILCRSRIEECLVVLGRDSDRLAPLVAARPGPAPRARVVRNPHPERGRSSSVRVGLQALASPPGALLFASVDQPLSPAVVESLIATAEGLWHAGAEPAAILIPTFEGRRGHPILVQGALLPELLEVGESTEGLRGVIHRRPDRVREVPWGSAEVLLDLNTPEDAERAGASIPPGSSLPPVS